MTIRRGEPWGVAVDRPEGLRVAHGDAELAALVAADPTGDHTVDAGDLHRTVGAPAGGRASMHRVPIDALDVVTDRSHHLAVAHVVIRRRWWGGAVVFLCNVEHVGRWKVAPRAHPNDGRFDVVTVDAGMGLRDRWEARRRLPSGTHVPHPSITVRTATEWTWSEPDRGAHVWIDGVDVGVRTSVTVALVPDATTVLV